MLFRSGRSRSLGSKHRCRQQAQQHSDCQNTGQNSFSHVFSSFFVKFFVGVPGMSWAQRGPKLPAADQRSGRRVCAGRFPLFPALPVRDEASPPPYLLLTNHRLSVPLTSGNTLQEILSCIHPRKASGAALVSRSAQPVFLSLLP